MSLINYNQFKPTQIHGFLNMTDGFDSSGNIILGQISTQRDILINNNSILNGLLTVSGIIYNNYYNKTYVDAVLNNYYSKNGGTSFFHAAGSGGLINTSLQQGAYLGWNNSGGTGETNFINSRGGGSGGFNWYNINSNNTISNYIALMTLDNNGNLTVTNINNYYNSSFINSNFYAKNYIDSVSGNFSNYYTKTYIDN